MSAERECADCGAPLDHRTAGDRCYLHFQIERRKPCPSMAHYNRGCRCDPCRELARQKRMEHRRRNGMGTVRGYWAQQRNRVES